MVPGMRHWGAKGGIGQVGWEEWDELYVAIDSGAVHTVGPPGIVPHVKLEETEVSRNGRSYRTANNCKIALHGKNRVLVFT